MIKMVIIRRVSIQKNMVDDVVFEDKSGEE